MLIVIFFCLVSSNLLEPNNSMLVKKYFWYLTIDGFIPWRLLKSFFLSSLQKGQCKRKCQADSISKVQSHTALTVFLKLCQNLCLFMWLKPKRSLVNNLLHIVSCKEKKEQLFTFMKLSSSDLNLLKDSQFRILLSNLFHSLIQYGENQCLKLSVWDENALRVSFCDDLVL